MNDSRSSRMWTLVSFAALVATVGVFASRRIDGRPYGAATVGLDEELRDAVA